MRTTQFTRDSELPNLKITTPSLTFGHSLPSHVIIMYTTQQHSPVSSHQRTWPTGRRIKRQKHTRIKQCRFCLLAWRLSGPGSTSPVIVDVKRRVCCEIKCLSKSTVILYFQIFWRFGCVGFKWSRWGFPWFPLAVVHGMLCDERIRYTLISCLWVVILSHVKTYDVKSI